MSVLFVALPLALALGAAGMIACVYCIRGGQYDDLETPAVRILIDDRDTRPQPAKAGESDLDRRGSADPDG
ncbi:cbb3-type cytochrome oxidase assembly protein CcoS [Rosistilla oblonga]|uniref:cbb3-type cytochrome oxidase assembly protein CcoS n=1 Tax=Rosistilla oblonga TaxID=2527990 RepID=UPI003A9773F1